MIDTTQFKKDMSAVEFENEIGNDSYSYVSRLFEPLEGKFFRGNGHHVAQHFSAIFKYVAYDRHRGEKDKNKLEELRKRAIESANHLLS